MEYYVLKSVRDRVNVWVTEIPENLDQQWELVEGVHRGTEWPEDIILDFSADRPEGMVLTDVLDNAHGWVIVSASFKDIVEEMDPREVEFLPVRLRNHKGAVLDDAYWIANLLAVRQVVDREHSEFRPHRRDPGRITSIQRMALRPEIAQEGLPLLRMAEDDLEVLVRSDLVERFGTAALTGVEFVPTAEFTT